MRIGVRYTGVIERVGGALNQVPVPLGFSMFGMPIARALQVAQRTGLLAELAAGSASAEELAARAGLRAPTTKLLLDTLCAAGLVRLRRGERYALARRSRKWLDPQAGSYVGDFLADTWHYWEWWGELEALLREGRSVEIHDKPAEDPYWRSYITGQYALARLSSGAVSRAVALPEGASSLIDVAGAHGEFSMALCRRHPGLRAVVLDLPGSARIGREIVQRAGLEARVSHLEGDMFQADLGGPYDGALCFNIIHHLTPDQTKVLFRRIALALRPGAPLCIVDLYTRARGERPDTGAILGLFFALTSGAAIYPTGEVSGWLQECGFAEVQVKRLPQLPGLALLRAVRRGP